LLGDGLDGLLGDGLDGLLGDGLDGLGDLLGVLGDLLGVLGDLLGVLGDLLGDFFLFVIILYIISALTSLAYSSRLSCEDGDREGISNI
jgi:hypothetical protein